MLSMSTKRRVRFDSRHGIQVKTQLAKFCNQRKSLGALPSELRPASRFSTLSRRRTNATRHVCPSCWLPCPKISQKKTAFIRGFLGCDLENERTYLYATSNVDYATDVRERKEDMEEQGIGSRQRDGKFSAIIPIPREATSVATMMGLFPVLNSFRTQSLSFCCLSP